MSGVAEKRQRSGTVLLTGGTGFLGEHVIRAVRAQGQVPRVLCREPTAALRELGASVYAGDLLAGLPARGTAPADPSRPDPTVPDELLAALDGCKEVYHLAGLVSRDANKGGDMMRLHVDGTRRLLQAAKQAGVVRVVLASTSGTIAVSRTPDPVPDETWPYPVDLCGEWPYYLSKIYQEKLALDLGQRLGLEIVCVNPSLLLGPGDRRGSSTEDVRKLLVGDVPAVPSGGLSFVDVRDAAQACVAAMERGQPGQRYLLGGPNWTFAEFLGRLSRLAKVDAPWLKIPAGWNGLLGQASRAVEHLFAHRGQRSPVDRISFEMGQHFWYCRSDKAQQALGFVARDPMETLDDTVRDVRKALAY